MSFDKRLRVESIKPNRLKIRLDVPDLLVREQEVAIPLHVEWLQGAKARNLKYDVKGTFVSTGTSFKNYPDYTFDNPTVQFNSEESQLITGTTNGEGDASVKTRLNVGATACWVALRRKFMKNPAISVSMRFVCCILLISVMSESILRRRIGSH